MVTVKTKEIYTEEDVQAKARSDAQQNIPSASQQEMTPYEQELVNGYRQIADEIAKTTRKELEDLDGQIKQLEHGNAARYDAAISFANNEYGAEEERLKENLQLPHLEEDCGRLKKIFEDYLGKLNRMPRDRMPHWIYICLVFLIGLGEIPLNLLVFKVFGDSPMENYAIAGVICLVLPWACHFVGNKVTTFGYKFSWYPMISAMLVTAAVVIGLYVVATIRQDFLYTHMQDMELNERLVHSSFLFFWINILIFTAASSLAAWVSDPVSDYPQIHRDLQKCRTKIRRVKAKLDKMLKDSRVARDKKIQQATVEKTTNDEKVINLKGQYDTVLVPAKHQEAVYLAEMQRKVQIYRTTNRQFRSDGLDPACFAIKPLFSLQLETLSEKLDNEK